MRRRTALIAASVLLLAAIPLAPAASAHATGPNLERLSFDPIPGAYTLLLRVENFNLVPRNVSAGDLPGEGQVRYLINDEPCAGECSRGAASLSDSASFTYWSLVVGDNLTAELLTHTGKPVNVTHEEIVKDASGENVTVNRTVPVRVSVVVKDPKAGSGSGPFVGITSGIPNAGDYTMRLNVSRFTLVPPLAEDLEDAVDVGHVLYSRNDRPCKDVEGIDPADVVNGTGPLGPEAVECGPAPGATSLSAFTFKGVQVGDRLSAELMRSDGSPLAPRVLAVVTVAKPAILIISGPPVEGDSTIDVRVTGFTLAAPGSPANAGTGYIKYLLKPKGSTSLVEPRACETGSTPASTAATSFKFCGLKEGDQVHALLYSGGNSVASAAPLAVVKLPKEGFVSPGIGPLLGILLLGLALRRR